MPNYACCRGADRPDDLINSVKTFLICDDLKPPYKGSNRERARETGSERGDEMIKVEMDMARMYNICQHLPTSRSNNFFSSSNGQADHKLLSSLIYVQVISLICILVLYFYLFFNFGFV